MDKKWKAIIIIEQVILLALSTILIVWSVILSMDMRELVGGLKYNWRWYVIGIVIVIVPLIIEIARKGAVSGEQNSKERRLPLALLIAIVLLAVSNLVIVPKSMDKLSVLGTYYEESGAYEPFTFTYNREDLKLRVLDNDGTNDGNPMKRTVELLDLIPTETLKELSDSGYKFVIDGARLAQCSFDNRREDGDKFCYMVLVLDETKEVLIAHCTPVSEDSVKCLIGKWRTH